LACHGVSAAGKFIIWFADIVTPNVAFKELLASRNGGDGRRIEIVMNSPQKDIFDAGCSQEMQPGEGERREFRVMYHGSIVHSHGVDIPR